MSDQPNVTPKRVTLTNRMNYEIFISYDGDTISIPPQGQQEVDSSKVDLNNLPLGISYF